MQLPKSKAEKYNCQDNDDWAVRFESSQVTDPSATNAQAQEQKRPNATDRRANSSQDAASKSHFRVHRRWHSESVLLIPL